MNIKNTKSKWLTFFLFFVILVTIGFDIYLAREILPLEKNVEPPISNNPSAPVKLIIPAIQVETMVEEVGMDKDGYMGLPSAPELVGWYNAGPTPGSQGSAVVAGHLDNIFGKPAVFFNLDKLKEGDDVYVVDKEGKQLHFVVKAKKLYSHDIADTSEIFGPSEISKLNLITCTGPWNKRANTYDKRVIIFTELKSEE